MSSWNLVRARLVRLDAALVASLTLVRLDKFSIRIPADLPPSFRGKAIKFSYHLVVGTNRSTLGPKLGPLAIPREAISRSMRVPVRVYNHVAGTSALPCPLPCLRLIRPQSRVLDRSTT